MTIRDWLYVLAAVVAAATFFWRVSSSTKASNENEKRAWQEVIVHKYLSERSQDGASLNEILQYYRSEASALPKELKKSDLSDLALRRVLLSLVQCRSVEQLGDDKYRLDIKNSEMEEAMNGFRTGMLPQMLEMVGFQGMMMSDVSVKKAVYNMVGSAPYMLNISDIAIKATEEYDVKSISEVRSFITQEIARDRLKVDAKGNVGFSELAKSED